MVRTSFRVLFLSFLLGLVLIPAWTAVAQGQMESLIDTTGPEISTIRFIGNVSFSNDELSNNIESKESPGKLSKFLNHISDKLGSRAEYLDDQTFHSDALRLETFYRNEGFYSVSVTPETRIDTSQNRVTLLFLIKEGLRSLVDSITYRGLDRLPPEVNEQIYRDQLIKKYRPVEKSTMDAEIKRILNILFNNGYPTARYVADSSGAYRKLSDNNFILQFGFIVGRRFVFGDSHITIEPPRDDLVDYLITRYLDYNKGELYSEDKRASSQRNLNRLDIFEGVLISHSTVIDTSSTHIPMEIRARARDRYELSPEISISDENNAFNLGLGMGFAARNFLGDARTLNIDGKARFQSLSNWNFNEVLHGNGFRDTSVIGALEFQFGVVQPYLYSRTMSGSWTLSAIADKQVQYILSIFRNKFSVSKRFAEMTYGIFDWTLERVSPEFLTIDTTGTAEQIAGRRQEDQPQFNSILTATLQRDKTNDIFNPSSGFFNSITLEESGILPELLPTLRSGLPFTQYYKMVLYGRWYRSMNQDTSDIFALKLKSGFQEKYGESRAADINIPLNRRFFGGGSGSVRGWGAQALGAMDDQSLVPLGGNFIFEGSMEFRINHFKGDGKWGFIKWSNIWGVYFFDFGNVWSDIQKFRPDQIAMAAGIGFRYDTFFGPFRIDYGFKVYDPHGVPGHEYIYQNRFFADTFNHGVFSFGIGHAF